MLMVDQRINAVVHLKVLNEPSVILLSVSPSKEKGDHETKDLGGNILVLSFGTRKATKQDNENDVLFSNGTGKLGKTNSECSYQESNLRPSDY